MTIFIVVGIIGVILWYALAGRDWLKSKPWAAGFFAWIEPIEIVAFKKSGTILFARMKMLTGVLLTVLTQLGSIDLTPIMPFVPEQYAGLVRAVFNLLPLLISIVGWADERQRYSSTKPVELVALPDKVVAENPRVAEAVAMADATKTEAVAVVVNAKAA